MIKCAHIFFYNFRRRCVIRRKRHQSSWLLFRFRIQTTTATTTTTKNTERVVFHPLRLTKKQRGRERERGGKRTPYAIHKVSFQRISFYFYLEYKRMYSENNGDNIHLIFFFCSFCFLFVFGINPNGVYCGQILFFCLQRAHKTDKRHVKRVEKTELWTTDWKEIQEWLVLPASQQTMCILHCVVLCVIIWSLSRNFCGYRHGCRCSAAASIFEIFCEERKKKNRTYIFIAQNCGSIFVAMRLTYVNHPLIRAIASGVRIAWDCQLFLVGIFFSIFQRCFPFIICHVQLVSRRVVVATNPI